MSEQESGAPQGALVEEESPVVADFTDSFDREEAHERERTADKPEPKQKAKKEPARAGEPQRHMVPLSEVLDTREKLREARERGERFERAWNEHQKKLQSEADNDPAPDMFKDPAGYNSWVERQLDRKAKAIAAQHVGPLQERISDYSLRVSEMQARSALGDQRWGALNTWLNTQPQQFKEWCLKQSDPYGSAYQHYRQATTFERLGNDDIDTYEQKLREKILAEIAAERAAPVAAPHEPEPSAQKQALPATFATKPSAGGGASPGSAPKSLGEILKDKPTRQDKRLR